MIPLTKFVSAPPIVEDNREEVLS